MTNSIIWLRRDIRNYDHRPFSLAIKNSRSIIPIFIFDKDILKRFSRVTDSRITFLADALFLLHAYLQKYEGQILIFHGKAREIIPKLSKILDYADVYAGEDHEPFTRERDKYVSESLEENGARLKLIFDHLIIPPFECVKENKEPFKVFTPYYKRWKKCLHNRHLEEAKVDFKKTSFIDIQNHKEELLRLGLIEFSSPKHIVENIGYEYAQNKLWNVKHAKKRLYHFTDHYLKTYRDKKDFLSAEGSTSAISPYIRFGLLSIRHVYNAAALHPYIAEKFVSQLCWREFYATIMYHFPSFSDTEFVKGYQGKKWNNDKEYEERFKNAQTGFPIVDAAIKQLLTDGWIHNRGRLIVGSFVTKHLLLDWRIGEEFFAQYLMDYEMSSNVGGWQWCASTGTDAQPYFRIFNPYIQSKKFDPEGQYIKKYLPQLKKIDLKYLHAPHGSGKSIDYPEPIVDHSIARQKAIDFYRIKIQ